MAADGGAPRVDVGAGAPPAPRRKAPWTAEDDAFLRANYAALGARAVAAALGRRDANVWDRASKLGVRSGRVPNRWSTAEDEFVRANYRKLGYRGCAAKLGRPPNSVRLRAWKLRAEKARSAWTSAQDEYLLLHWQIDRPKKLARALHPHTWGGILLRAWRMKLPRGVPNGYETMTQAARRTGYTAREVRAALAAHSPNRMFSTYGDARPVGRHRYAEPDAIDAALHATYVTNTK